MAEGGGFPWSSRRRKSRRRERDRDSIENSNEEIESDLLRVVLSDSEDFVPDDVKSTASVACSCDSDFQDEQANLNVSCEDKSSLDFVDLDPEVRRRAQIQRLSRFPNKVTPPKRSKSRKSPSEEICGSDRSESGLGYYGRCLQEAKRARNKAEKDAKNRRIQDESKTPRRRRPLSMVSSRTGNNDAEFYETRRRRFSFSWGFRRVSTDTNLEDAVENLDISENGENLPRSSSTTLRARQDNQSQSSGMNFEEFHRQKREKARLKAAQHRLEYFLIKDIVSITNCPWYWGKINRFQAEKILEGYPEGTFLLRDSAQYHYLFSVSFRRYHRTYHARIEQWKHKYSFDKASDCSFYSTSVCQLLRHYARAERCMYYEPLLITPLQRKVPASLQEHCRAEICSRTTFQGVDHLPLPNSLKLFLREFHYKVPVKKTEEKSTQTPIPKKRFSSFFHRD